MPWLTGWDKRIKVDIDYTNKIGASVTQFPVTVFLKSGNGETTKVFDEVGANKQKIAITKADGETQLYAEIDRWDNGNSVAEIHISKSDWIINADTYVYLYYDNDHADNVDYIGIVAGSAPATNVWDANFKIVAHMKDLTTSSVKDSSGNGLDGAKKGANEPNQVDAKIGKGQDFDGVNDYIFFPNDASYKELNGKNLTGLVWIKTTDTGVWNESIFGIYSNIDAASPTPNQAWHLFYGNGQIKFWIRINNNGETKDALSTTTTLKDGNWHLVGFRKNGKTIEVLVDGVSENSAALTQEGATDNNLVLGLGATYARFLDFDIDEFTISTVARSNAWLKASYNSGNDSLLAYGNEEVTLPEGYKSPLPAFRRQ